MEGMQSQFQPVHGGQDGPKFVVALLCVVIVLLFVGMIGLAVVSNS